VCQVTSGDRPGVPQRPAHTASTSTRTGSKPLTCTSTVSRRRPQVPGTAAVAAPAEAWVRPGDRQGGGQGTGRGRPTTSVHNRRDVHVSTTGRRSPPTMSQQPHSGPHQREDRPSPGSTRVMTRMRELSRKILEPHSGWGRLGWGGSGEAHRDQGSRSRHRGFPPEAPSRHDEHRSDGGRALRPSSSAQAENTYRPRRGVPPPWCPRGEQSWGGSRDEVPGGT